MRVGLVDVDRTGFPNLALMKLASWHRARGDEVTLVAAADWLERPLVTAMAYQRLYASVVFSWNRAKAETLAALGAEVGGSGVDLARRLPADVEAAPADYSLYGIDYGLGFLSRGCIRTCAHCIVPAKDGTPRQVATIDALLNRASARRRPFVVLLDDEFFWRVGWAIAQLETFTTRGIDWCASQGLDIRCTTPALCAALAASPFWNLHRTRRQLTFAFDDVAIERRYRRGVEELLTAGVKAWQLQSYVLVGFDAATRRPRPLHADDERRIAVIREYGIDPFVMVYRDPTNGQAVADPRLRDFARWVNRHLYRVCAWPAYVANLRGAKRTA